MDLEQQQQQQQKTPKKQETKPETEVLASWWMLNDGFKNSVCITEVTDTHNPFDRCKGNNSQLRKLNSLLSLRKPLSTP